MAYDHDIESHTGSQGAPGIELIQIVLSTVDASKLLDTLQKYRKTGRPGYPLKSLWRSYLASFILNLPTTNALVRLLEDNKELRLLCGFSQMPGRRTFNRFILRLANHVDLVEECLVQATSELQNALPDFGKVVAIDSTSIAAYSNGNRTPVSDADASWMIKHSAKSRTGEDYYYGYKYHAIADVTHDMPITGIVTTAARNDSPMMPEVLDRAAEEFDWFAPDYVIGDRGYDAESNFKTVIDRGAAPIIHIRDRFKNRKKPQERLYDDIYTFDGVPTCLGVQSMEYVRSDAKGHLYRCPQQGCQLKDRKGVVYCKDELWVHPNDSPRMVSAVRRNSKVWADYYAKRQGIERIFKSLKESRRLEAHNVRGIERVRLHVAMAVLAFQATALVHLQTGEVDDLRWMVRRIA